MRGNHCSLICPYSVLKLPSQIKLFNLSLVMTYANDGVKRCEEENDAAGCESQNDRV